MGKTTVKINEHLLKEAVKVIGAKSKKEAIAKHFSIKVESFVKQVQKKN